MSPATMQWAVSSESKRRRGRGRPRALSAASAAFTPLRTALSMVAGHPVAVHAPARYRPGASVRAPGRRRPTPGVGANVAVRSRVTKKSRTPARRAPGSSLRSSGR